MQQNRRIKAARAALISAAAVAIAAGGFARAQDDPVAIANRNAYNASIKCFVVIGMLVGDARDHRQPELSAAYDTKARRSFDFAIQLGHKLGLSGETMDEDFGMAQAQELPKLVKDVGYFQRSSATCKALGLL